MHGGVVRSGSRRAAWFRLPIDLETGQLPARWKQWQKHDPIHLVGKYRDNLRSCAASTWIAAGATSIICTSARAYFPETGAERIKHTYEEFDDTHSSVDYRMDVSLPFLYRALKP